jgi:alpha-tubulin suppressor-like RCC1 family protein
MRNIATPTLAVLALAMLFSPGARAEGGRAEGWGGDEFGQIGSSATVPAPVCKCIEAPVTVDALSGITQIAPGESHTLALLGNGTVMAWGGNASGQVGDNTTEPRSAPVPVPLLSGVVGVAAGSNHSLALLSNGTVMAWGDNVNGELGNGVPGGSSIVPVAVPGLQHVVAIQAGFRYSLALLADGTVMAWGLDLNAQLGAPTDPTGCACIAIPTAVPGVAGAMAISAGSDFGMALLADGTVRAWGSNHGGELGNGAPLTEPPCNCLAPLSVLNLAKATSISAGGAHTLATLAGGVQSWGLNREGELGNGAPPPSGCECVATPAPVVGLKHPQQVSAGGSHNLALLPNGTVSAWGGNGQGQLGNHSSGGSAAAPVPVSGIKGASAVYAGAGDSFALIGRSQTLTVALTGRGKGAVGGPGILCPLGCGGRFPQGQVEILRAQPATGKANAFAGFSGACKGTAPCQVKLAKDKTVVATFGRPKGTKIVKSKINRPRGSASFSFAAPGAITGFECQLIKPRRRFSKCRSPKRYKHLAPGRYTFRVRALDILGADPKPALRRFTIR